jgi:RHS repeat-associated protein
VSWFSNAWHSATHEVGQLAGDGKRLLGQAADQGAHLAGRALTDVGLGQLGNTVDGWGDAAAGALDPELQLGQTDDPTQLIHGDPGAIRSAATQLHGFSGAFGQTASGLTGIDTSHWTGEAADAFRAKYAPEPDKWQTASDASGDAGSALESYAGTVTWAQGRAREAIALYAQGVNASRAAMAAYNQRVDAYNTAATAYNAKLSAGLNPGTRPEHPGAFSDPGADSRQQAQAMLNAARAQRDRAGTEAASVMSRATDQAPASPGFWSQARDTLSDEVQAQGLGDLSAAAGITTGIADIAKFVRDMNPADAWNLRHPTEFLAGVSSMGAGLVHDVVHPQDLLGQVVGGGWGSDPFEAAGKLVPQVALALASDGAGTAGDAAADAGADAAGDAGSTLEDAGTKDPAGAAQPKDAQKPVNDPVDVVTGTVILYQVDAELPGLLPLVVRRAHRSSYQAGRWFGRRWASTLDQRLEVSPKGVFVGDDDGVILSYPHPEADAEAVLPVSGAPWPLHQDGDAYTVTDPQTGIVRRFEPCSGFFLSAEGHGAMPLVSVTDRAGHQIRFDYTPDGIPQTITHDGGYQVKVLTAGNRVAALALAGAGAQGQDVPLVAYRYDLKGNLSQVINSSGQPLRYSYDGADRLNGWENRNGFSYRHYYDQQGRCVRGEGPDGTLSGTLTYDPDNLTTTHTDATGAVTVYQLTPQRRLAAITDPLGNTTRNDYDTCGRLVGRTDPLGRTTRWTYDQAGNLTAITRPDGSQATAEYNDQNLPIVITEPGGATWRQDYDQAGNLLSRQAPDGAVVRYSYDDRGYLAGTTDPLGNTTRVTSGPAGLPVEVIDPDGAVTRYERDPLGRVTVITGPDGAVTRLSWTLEGRLAGRMFPDGTVEQFGYDSEGNLTEQIDPAAGLTTFEYGAFDHLVASTDPGGTRAEVGYDHLLRQTSVTIAGTAGSPTSASLTWSYDYDRAGRLAAETDYNGAITRYTHDAAGQLTGVVNAAEQQITNSYDLLGNLSEREADGAITRFGYDPAGRLVRAESPAALLEFELDEMGRVTAETCNSRKVVSSYDAAGRRVQRITPSGVQTKWGYDAAGRPVMLQCDGQELRFGYDQASRETSRELPGGARLAQGWNAAGRLATQVLIDAPRPDGPLGLQARPDVPSAGETAPQPSPSSAARVLQRRAYQYRGDGTLVGLDDLLSGPRRLTLDEAGRVTAVTGPDWSERYAYDPAGNIGVATWPVPPLDLGGLAADSDVLGLRQYAGTLITRAGRIRYRHDPSGRIIVRQRIRDSRKPDTWHYNWDAENRLTAVTTPDGTIWRYLYDPFGRRIAKQRLDRDNQVAEDTTFTWDGAVLAEQSTTIPNDRLADRQLAAESTPAGPLQVHVTTWDYQPGTFTPLTQLERWRHVTQEQVDQRFYAIVADLIGMPAELVGSDGTLAGYQQHTLWGTALWRPDGAATPLRFPGQYHDPETGLHYNNHRYYDPAIGRYLTPDPFGLTPSPNPHTYVPNPTTSIDPLGLEGCETTQGQGNSGDLQRVGDFANRRLAFSHYAKHAFGIDLRWPAKPSYIGPDMPEFSNFSDYQSAARRFMGGGKPEGALEGLRSNGDLARFDPRSGYFGVRSPSGIIRTFFRPKGETPSDWLQYFFDQF